MGGYGFIDLAGDPEALALTCRSMGLCQPGEPIEARALTGGVSSNILEVRVAGRTFCVKQALPRLKVAKEWLVPVDRVFAEVDWLELAAGIAPDNVPALLGVDRERGAFAMAFLDPSTHPNLKTQMLGGRSHRPIATAIGALLARLHSATSRRADLATRFAHEQNFHALRLEAYLVEAARVHPDLAPHLGSLVDTTGHTRRAVIHGDVSPKNILIGPRGPILLDAECATYGDPAFDLAFLLNHLLLKGLHLPALRPDCRAMFEQTCDTYRRGVDWEAPTELDARCAALLPGLTLARVDGKSPVEYLGDTQRMIVRNAARALLADPPATLADLCNRWFEAIEHPIART